MNDTTDREPAELQQLSASLPATLDGSKKGDVKGIVPRETSNSGSPFACWPQCEKLNGYNLEANVTR